MHPSDNDLPQMLLINAAKQFIADLRNANYIDAANFLERKYIVHGYNTETVRIAKTKNNPTQILNG
jgi:hypothetical protein